MPTSRGGGRPPSPNPPPLLLCGIMQLGGVLYLAMLIPFLSLMVRRRRKAPAGEAPQFAAAPTPFWSVLVAPEKHDEWENQPLV
eukprot:5178480-Prymnesium_polylepis.1